MEIACIYYIIHSARAHGASSMKIVFPRDVLTHFAREKKFQRTSPGRIFPNVFHNSLPLFLHAVTHPSFPGFFLLRFKHKVGPLNAVLRNRSLYRDESGYSSSYVIYTSYVMPCYNDSQKKN